MSATATSFQDYVQALERQAGEDAKGIAARLHAGTAPQRGLFIDCGSNLGQGFGQFSRYFLPQDFDYVLIEPNPNCWPALDKIVAAGQGRIELLKQAASTKVGVVQFFGLEQDPTSQGGSMLADHNSKYYAANAATALEVPCFSLAQLIEDTRARYPSVVLKLDIEGGEYEVLPDLIARGAHKLLDAAYIEFHSQYMAEPKGSAYRDLEARLKAQIVHDQVPLRIWF